MIISACTSEAAATVPMLEPEKPSLTDEAEETVKETQTTEINEDGRSLFVSKVCSGCHIIEGIPEAQGKVGPDLTRQAGNSLIVGVLPNTDENMKTWLRDPSAVKPATLMPNQNLTESEIDALLAFLRTLK